MNIVEFKDVNVFYKGNTALKNINLDIASGSLVSLIGPNGAGKSTLLTLINGFSSATSGTINIFNRKIERANAGEIRKRIGYISQESVDDPRAPVSVYEAVSIGRIGKRGLMRRLNSEDHSAIKRAIRSVGLEGFEGRPVGRLSGGERQKTAIARALAQEPEIMLMDEPTSSLDLKAGREIIGIIDGIYREKKLTIIYVTHILHHIPSSCTETVMLKKGQIIWRGAHRDTYSRRLICSLYGLPENYSPDNLIKLRDDKVSGDERCYV